MSFDLTHYPDFLDQRCDLQSLHDRCLMVSPFGPSAAKANGKRNQMGEALTNKHLRGRAPQGSVKPGEALTGLLGELGPALRLESGLTHKMHLL
jgi:hypothetical protein